MSLTNSISTAVTGMIAQSTCLANISDNLANTTTTAFKSVGTNFSDIVCTAASNGFGIGTRASPVYYNNVQGSVSLSKVATNLAISGKGLFAVTQDGGDGTVCYTRCGDFSLNYNGTLSNGAGYNLMGWEVDPDTGLVESGSVVPMNFYDYVYIGIATTEMTYGANLPSEMPNSADTIESDTTIYDSEGITGHEVEYIWRNTGFKTWELTINAPGGAYDEATQTEADYTATATFLFNNGGQIESITSADCAVDGTNLSLDLSYRSSIDPYVAALPQTVTAGFSGLTQFTDNIINNISFDQNGAGREMFGGVSIDSKGYTSVNYSNGVIRTYYQVPLALFNSPESLQRMSGNVFHATPTSGTASYLAASEGGAGDLTVSALESSNVDIADQFTRMIQAQRAYSANSRTVMVADAMMHMLAEI